MLWKPRQAEHGPEAPGSEEAREDIAGGHQDAGRSRREPGDGAGRPIPPPPLQGRRPAAGAGRSTPTPRSGSPGAPVGPAAPAVETGSGRVPAGPALPSREVPAVPSLVRLFVQALRELAAAGEPERACMMAAQAWSLLRHDFPREAQRLNGLLHALTGATHPRHAGH
ncbi:hypothetical protein DYI95_007500 [Thermaerobacter sp. PB12/4term]|uniref:hypothetical protein n=1 Tax=Thermaerobacter sp. PB12/4term TaxID=2293838 RepID=UPI000E32A911|nr:hypothetical protein [Thermaerobacter sp. PB12/4term]QIA27399.1 hypothetical protein DYI95_007500 [Thermaerobacter sp. PB12/4term]